MKVFSSKLFFYVFYLLLATLAYLILSSGFNFWGDELWSVYASQFSIKDFIIHYIQVPDNHPPLYYLLLNIWVNFFKMDISSEWFYRLFSIFWHFLTVILVAELFLKGKKQKFFWLAITFFSSYFFMYAHMVRYYSLTAFLYVLFFYIHLQWIKSFSLKRSIQLIIIMFLLGMTDYPVFMFAFGYFGLYFLKDKFKHFKVYLHMFISQAILIFIPILFFMYRYSLSKSMTANFGARPSFISSLIKFLIGADFSCYHLIFGEFIHVWFSPLLVIFLLVVLIIAWNNYKKLDNEEQKTLNHNLFFILYNIFIVSFFLSFVLTRYPIFSYARFILGANFILLLSLVILFFKRHKFILMLLILIGAIIISQNIHKKYFINPIYFFPNNLFVRQVEDLTRQYSDFGWISLPDSYEMDFEGYVWQKYFPDYNFKGNKYTFFFISLDMSLDQNGLEQYKQYLEKSLGKKIIEIRTFDNLELKIKSVLHRSKLMKIPNKYAIFVLE